MRQAPRVLGTLPAFLLIACPAYKTAIVSIDAGQCGAEGAPCCAGTACNSGLVCESAMCVTPPCGGAGQSCCGGTACNAGLVCEDSVCLGTSPDAGSVDAGNQDSGTDAGVPDAGLDAGGDAGPTDAGPTDAGDPCAVDNGGCSANAVCSSASGQVTCECLPGYISNGGFGSGLECASPCTSGNGGCDPHAMCALSDGGVTCTCDPGFISGGGSGSSVTCTNPCTVQNGGCSANAICHFAGGAVSCGCPAGYISNGQFGGALACTNPCTIDNGGCDPHATCSLVGAMVACACDVGYVGDGQSCSLPTDGGVDAGVPDAGVDAGPTLWEDATPPVSPSYRTSSAMAFDSARSVSVLFGGNGTSADGDTWEWNGAAWNQVTPPASPPARYSHAMAFDSGRGVIVLFGGCLASGGQGACAFGSDTWEWNGSTWTQRLPSTSPPGVWGHALSYDSGRGVTTLFGGCLASDNGGKCTTSSSQTWEWDGQNWSQRSPETSPSARWAHGMVYDSFRGVTVLFGGCVGTGYCTVPNNLVNETWEWNGTTWAEQPSSPFVPRRNSFVMAFDSVRNVSVVFGGESDALLWAGDTWLWDGTSWTEVFPVLAPPGRPGPIGDYDSSRAETVIFGGYGSAAWNDTWVLPSSSL
jgi:hypothetical protein